MKIVLLGKNGQVGRELQRTLLPLGDVVALGRDDVDLVDLVALGNMLDSVSPDIIVNAAAYTAVDKAEDEEATAYQVNCELVTSLADYALSKDALLVHFSTDYVFDGEKPGAYVESDETNPGSAYGRSKRSGEEAILDSGCSSLIFRTSWVFSASGNNFVKTMLRLARDRDSLNVVADQFGAPTCAELIADVTALAIARYQAGGVPDGIYHLTAAGDVSWHGLATHVVERALKKGVPLLLKAEDINAIPTEAYPLPAKRPGNSRLSTEKLSRTFGLRAPDWRIHVDRTVDQLTPGEPLL